MTNNLLKINWERFKDHPNLSIAEITNILKSYTNDPIANVTVLSDGCANSNYKITFQTNQPPVVLRIYMREKSALAREFALHRLVTDKVPVAKFLLANDDYHYPYAIMEWVDGILLRELVINNDKNAVIECLHEAGNYLNVLRQIKFAQGGFFQEKLLVRPFTVAEKYVSYVRFLLNDSTVKQSMGSGLINSVTNLIDENLHLLPNEASANLTHGDYDPANMMVKEVNSQWQIAAIMDWEFAYAGTYLLDVGLMLRYSHRLPSYYETSFVAGMQADGFQLPREWKKQAKLMDLLCLLQLAHYNPSDVRPIMNNDVVSLIQDIVTHWNSYDT